MDRFNTGAYNLAAGGRHSPNTQRRQWQKSSPNGCTSPQMRDPGWDPRQAGQARPQYTPQQIPRAVPVNRVGNAPPACTPASGVHHIEYDEEPAWKGSLKSCGALRPWEVHAAVLDDGYQNGSPLQPPPAAQHAAAGAAPSYHDNTATAAHLQYNSPLQLYSKENAENVLHMQTAGTAAEGTVSEKPKAKVNKPADPQEMEEMEVEWKDPGHSFQVCKRKMRITGGGVIGPDGKAVGDPAANQDFTKSPLAQIVHMEDRKTNIKRARSPLPQPVPAPSGVMLQAPAQATMRAPSPQMLQPDADAAGHTEARQSPSMNLLQQYIIQQGDGDTGMSDF